MFAKLIDTMGDDLKVCNAAKRSFNNLSEWQYTASEGECPAERYLAEKDVKLIRYLARGLPTAEMESFVDEISHEVSEDEIIAMLNKYRSTATHWVPFAHCQLTFHIVMPIFVARQLIRHTVGVVISEMSRRYVDEDPTYWFPGPGEWRLAAENVKQGSSKEKLHGTQAFEVEEKVAAFCDTATKLYRELVDDYKVAPELARIILPQNTDTDWHWTVSLVTLARVLHLRLDSHAQQEIRELAQSMYEQAMEKFPVSLHALMTYGTE